MPKKKEAEKTEKVEEKPIKETLPQKELHVFEEKVVELAKKGLTAEKIGEELRKQGFHPQKYGKISRILKAKGLYTNPDIKNIEDKLERINVHREKNTQDKRAMRERERIISLLRKQKRYHKVA